MQASLIHGECEDTYHRLQRSVISQSIGISGAKESGITNILDPNLGFLPPGWNAGKRPQYTYSIGGGAV